MRGIPSGNVRTSSVGRSRNLACPRVRTTTGCASLSMWVIRASGKRGVEEHQGAAGLENAEVRGHDLPVVLRHGDGHDLVRAGEEGSNSRGHVFRSRVELGEGQRLSGVRDL